MVPDPIADVIRELLVRQVAEWAPVALQRGRRATLVYAYTGADTGSVESVLRVFTGLPDALRGRRLAAVVLAASPGDLGLGVDQSGLPAEVSVYAVPGGLDRLAVVLKAAGAAGAPVLAVLDASHGPAPSPATLAALAAGRPAELLLVLGADARAGSEHRATVPEAGFDLVTEVELVGGPEHEPRLVVFATSSGKRLEAFKDGIWTVGHGIGVRYDDPYDPGPPVAVTPDPSVDPLGSRLLTRLTTSGPGTVGELRLFTMTRSIYRAEDANRALLGLLAAGLVSRAPSSGRLGGDVLVEAVVPVPDQPSVDG
ncbi:hypothetical protein AB0J90_17445 [Micromonospora sp. NPDC049523]|uniref:hypothetical protein n=1 Tax=Micromonospora sp. NPDC049523 TaxID=3155921 RepID=UPI00342E3181